MISNSFACQISFVLIPPNLSRSVIRMRYSAVSSFGVSPRRHTEDTRFGGHAHKVREINPTIPWIALPNRIAPFGGGVPGAIRDSYERMGSMVHVSGRTVDNDIARGPVDGQRWRIRRLGWEECISLIIGVPRIEKSKKLEGTKAEIKYRWRCLNSGFSF